MNDDATTLQIERKFLGSEKPSGIVPIDILQIVYLMTWKGEDHPLFPSQQTFARMFGVDAKTIQRSQQRLEKAGWLSRPQRRGKTNALSLRYENIPAEYSLQAKITPHAKQLALWYKQTLLRYRKKFPAQWLSQQFVSASRILEMCSGDVELARKLIGFAMAHPRHYKRSRQSLYNLFGRWDHILKDYSEFLEALERERQVKEAREEVTA